MARHQKPDDQTGLISTGKAARYLGCSRQTVRNLIGSGFLRPAVLPMGDGERSHYRIYSQDVFQLAERLQDERENVAPNGKPFSVKGHRLDTPDLDSENFAHCISYDINIQCFPA